MTAARAAVHPRGDAKVARVAVDRLRANPHNIRTDLGDLRELAESIRHEGVLVPLMAEDCGSYLQILHGHRRWAAAQIAGVRRVPVVIVDIHEPQDVIFVMLAEDKKEPVDSADKRRAIRALREQFGMTWQAIADRLGVTPTTVRVWAGAAPARAVTAGTAGRHHAYSNRPPAPPRIAARSVYDVLARFDGGELVPTDVVEACRGWLGDWTPKPVQITEPPPASPTGPPSKPYAQAGCAPATSDPSTPTPPSTSWSATATPRPGSET